MARTEAQYVTVPRQILPANAATGDVFKSIQNCRGIAALLVVLCHLGGTIASTQYFGRSDFVAPFRAGGITGVVFFFVLSGFIISSVHWPDIGHPNKFSAYLFKRALRIYPSYWIAFIAIWLLMLGIIPGSDPVPKDFVSVVKALALVPQDPAIVGGTGAPVIGVAWTLQYEVIFYAFFGLLILNSLLAVVLLSLVLLGWLLDWPMPLDFMKFHFFLLFAAGMVVGWLLRRELWSSFALPAATAGGVGFVGVCTLAALDSSLDVTTVDSGLGIPLLIGASASLTIFGLVTLERQGWNFASRSGGLLGDASYVLYLLHYPIISMVCKISLAAGLSGFSGALIAWVFGLSLCIATAIVFHSLIERRIISIGRQLLGRFNL